MSDHFNDIFINFISGSQVDNLFSNWIPRNRIEGRQWVK